MIDMEHTQYGKFGVIRKRRPSVGGAGNSENSQIFSTGLNSQRLEISQIGVLRKRRPSVGGAGNPENSQISSTVFEFPAARKFADWCVS